MGIKEIFRVFTREYKAEVAQQLQLESEIDKLKLKGPGYDIDGAISRLETHTDIVPKFRIKPIYGDKGKDSKETEGSIEKQLGE